MKVNWFKPCGWFNAANRLWLLISSLALAVFTCHGQATNRLTFPASGFSIAPLESPASQSPHQPLIMFLPLADGFSPNVNVQIQPYADTLEAYLALSVQQCQSAGFKLLQHKAIAKSVAVFEYRGEMQGKQLHWYARAEKLGAQVYLATATAPEDQWSKLSAQLMACVDSLRCEIAGAAAAPKPAAKRR